jgi:2,4-dienoyl-CoA reductase-like NADH-dependent reductase (Old Yellow Enzyme family)
MPVSSSKLFQPIQLGPNRLANRMVMAPMSRNRADAEAAHALTAKYYEQRASVGLIVTEASPVSPQGRTSRNAPGIWSEAQLAGWRLVTQAVHAKRGRVFLQLWHAGRISHPSVQPGGALPVAPSAVRMRAVYIANGGYDRQRAVSAVENGYADLVSFGVLYLANPDLVARFRVGARLNSPDRSTFYGGGERGYTDYPSLAL